MKKINFLCLTLLLLLAGFTPTHAQLDELEGMTVSVSTTEATTLSAEQWYVMFNRGHETYLYENSSSHKLYTSRTSPNGLVASQGAAYLVRLVESGTKYYLQTGLGRYFGTLKTGDNNGTTATATTLYSIGTIGTNRGHFYLLDSKNMRLDANADEGTVAGWETGEVTTTGGNNDWAFYPVTMKNNPGAAIVNEYLSKSGLYRIYGNRPNTYAMYETEKGSVRTAKHEVGETPNYAYIWILEKQSKGFALRNAKTGKYIQNSEGGFTTGTDKGVFYIKYSAGNKEGSNTTFVTISNDQDFDDKCFNDNLSHEVVAYSANNGTNNEVASDWTLVPADDVTDAMVKAQINSNNNFVEEIVSKKYYRIHNLGNGKLLTENPGDNSLWAKDAADEDYAQYWQLIQMGTKWRVKNVLSENTIKPQSTINYPYETAQGYTTLAVKAVDYDWQSVFTLDENNGRGLHSSASSTDAIVNWYTSDATSQWCFEEVTIDEAKLEEARAEMNVETDLIQNAANYYRLLSKYFKDGACDEISDAYAACTEEELKGYMEQDGLHKHLQEIVLKVKNNAWTIYDEAWDKTEKTFRSAIYYPYGDGGYGNNKWTGVFGNGYCFGHLTNPTGISVKDGELLKVFVDAIPSKQTIYLEIVSEGAATGNRQELAAGMNLITAPKDGMVFIDYTVQNIKSVGGKYQFTAINQYDPVRVHIEGGTVEGYFDLTKGDTDEDWAFMRQHLLKGYTSVILKTKYSLFNMNKAGVLAACPVKMEGLMKIWENLIKFDYDMMGIDEFISDDPDKHYFNCLLNNFSMKDGYMHATSHGTYYQDGTLGSIMNYESMESQGGSLWGPAHETGHIYQTVINLAGQTEVSNNLFSNVAVFYQGHQTSRTMSTTTTFSNFAAKSHWLDRNIWERTHMYFQLFQFFHVQGYMPTFYSDIYKALRRDGINQSHSSFVPATQDYLKWYVKCCEVSGYDLTEFFDAYGFFVVPKQTPTTLNGETRDCLVIDDYSKTYLTITQEMIDESLAKVKAMDLKPCNAIFITDRAEAPLATYVGHKEGELKTSYMDDMKIGDSGTLGQYTDYNNTPATGYTCNMGNSGKLFGISGGTGAVGVKLYDEEGNLAALYNDVKRLRIPSKLEDTDYVIKVAGSDGTDQQIWPVPDGIEGITTTPTSGENAIYDFTGRRVLTPQSGKLYIINGVKKLYK